MTRIDLFLESIANKIPSKIKPLTRKEIYLSYLSGNDFIELPKPITKKRKKLI